MTGFRRLFFAALLAGLAAGLATSVVQAAKLWPMIASAELLEASAPAKDHAADHAHDHGWSPEGVLRPALTVLFNIAAGVGFGLILNALVRLRALAKGGGVNAREGVLWGIAGFTAFALAPAVGLPPELPGMAGGELLHRQIWWAMTAFCSAGAIALWVFRGGSWCAVAVILAALPHLVGAPHAHEHGAVPGEMGAAFAAASLAASAVFWVVLGGVSGWAQDRWSQSA